MRAELPHWLYLPIEQQYEDAAALLAALAGRPAGPAREPDRASRGGARGRWRIAWSSGTRYSPEGIRLAGKPALTQWPAYREGRIEVQDEGSQLIARLVQPRRGEMVVDFCAGAGKTLALGALMRSSGTLYAFDIIASRARSHLL